MSHYPRPTEPVPVLDKEPVPGTCPECGDADLKTYPVNSEGGWFIVVKCQNCLHSVSREQWRLLGPIEVLADSIHYSPKDR